MARDIYKLMDDMDEANVERQAWVSGATDLPLWGANNLTAGYFNSYGTSEDRARRIVTESGDDARLLSCEPGADTWTERAWRLDGEWHEPGDPAVDRWLAKAEG